MSDTTSLIPLETVNAAALFSGGGMDELLRNIRAAATGELADTETDAGRKRIASRAYAVARSKTTIDEAGKQLVEGWKKQAASVDAERRRARDYLDALKDEVRAPLTAWEAEQEAIAEAARKAEADRLAAVEAERVAEIERREREVAEREAAIRKAEADARDKEAREEAARRQIEREAAIRAEAAQAAQREAAEAIKAAEERVAREAEAAERERAAKAAFEREQEEKRANNKRRQQTINGKAKAALVAAGIDEATAETVIRLIVLGKVPAITISYL